MTHIYIYMLSPLIFHSYPHSCSNKCIEQRRNYSLKISPNFIHSYVHFSRDHLPCSSLFQLVRRWMTSSRDTVSRKSDNTRRKGGKKWGQKRAVQSQTRTSAEAFLPIEWWRGGIDRYVAEIWNGIRAIRFSLPVTHFHPLGILRRRNKHNGPTCISIDPSFPPFSPPYFFASSSSSTLLLPETRGGARTKSLRPVFQRAEVRVNAWTRIKATLPAIFPSCI